MRHVVVAVRKTSRGIRLVEHLPDPFNPGRRFAPRLRTAEAAQPPRLVPIAPPHSRAHIVEAFVCAWEHREALHGLIANARSRTAAQRSLIRECGLSAAQAEAMLELRWWQFTRTAQRAHEAELRNLLRAGSALRAAPRKMH